MRTNGSRILHANECGVLRFTKHTIERLRNMKEEITTADDWFATGRRVHYDVDSKRFVPKKAASSMNTITVFEKTVVSTASIAATNRCWITLLPGFPDGSYGFNKIESQLLELGETSPQLYVEYQGQGGSDTPDSSSSSSSYSIAEYANLVEAHWQAKGITRTVIVAFDFSSLVMMELLKRQQERSQKHSVKTKIEHVLSVNGILYFDDDKAGGKSRHPYSGLRLAKRSNLVMYRKLLPLFSKPYQQRRTTKEEMREIVTVVRRNGAASSLKYVTTTDHKQNAQRWNLFNVVTEYAHEQGISFRIVTSKEVGSKRNAMMARELLRKYNSVKFDDSLPGGHMALLEEPERVAKMTRALIQKDKLGQQFVRRTWTTVDPPEQLKTTGLEISVPSTSTRITFPWSSIK